MTPWTAVHQVSLSMGIPQARVLEWVAMPFSRGSSNPGIKPRSPTLQVDSLLSEPSGKPDITNQLSHSVRSDSLWPHGLQPTRLPCPSPTPRATQTHVHHVSGAIQPSHPLSSPSRPAFNLSQHQGLFQWVGSLYQVAKVLEFQLQHQSFQWIFRTDFL